MPESGNNRPSVLIDLARDQIRIHRNTIRAMGNPEYILLIVNPDKRMLGILRSSADEKRAHHIRYQALGSQSYELRSKSLVHHLRMLCPDWCDGEKYRIYGKMNPKDASARFSMSEVTQIKQKEGYHEQ